MKKEGWILVVFICLFIGTMIGMNLPFYITGFATGNASIGNINYAPTYLTVPNQSWTENTQKVLNLSEYCSDVEGYDLTYNSTAISEIVFSISNGVVTFTPNTDFSGIRVVTFSVFDYVNTIYTNNITLVVSEVESTTETPATGGSSARVITDAEGEEIILRLAPTMVYDETKIYYLNDYVIDNIALLEDLEVGSLIYFGSEDEEGLAYAQIALIDDKKLLLNFVDEKEGLLQLEFLQGNYFELDEDGNGWNDYYVYADYIGNSVVDLRFVKVEKMSFGLYSFVSEYWFIVIVLVVILTLIILILKKKV